MRIPLILFFSLISISLIAQSSGKESGTVLGKVFDEKDKEPIIGASVRILHKADSTYVQGTISDSTGLFRIDVFPGKYITEITVLGYKPFFGNIELTEGKKLHDFGKILLSNDGVLLGEAEIVAEVPPIVVKGDTIEYNAASYNVDENALLNDLIKKIPGVEIDANGNITANGKPVQKILVDGKEFFGNDIALALNNLPASMIKKLQLFKDESDNAKITGFRDKNPEQVLNIVVKEELKQSIFGDVKGGYGSNDKYTANAVVNYMRNENQASFIGDMNNVGDSEYGYGGSGINEKKNAGFNYYSQGSGKLKIGGNIRYSNNNNLLETQSNDYTFRVSRHSKEQTINKSIRDNLNTGVNLQWTPDSMTTIYLRSFFSFDKTTNNNNSNSMTYAVIDSVTYGSAFSNTDDKGYSINNSLTIGRKLNSKGRTISLAFNNSWRKNDSDGSNYSETIYPDATPIRIIDQRTDIHNKSQNISATLSYVEPLGEDKSIMLSYTINNNTSDRIRDTRKKDDKGNYTIIDSAYTRTTKTDYTNQNITLAFQAKHKKLNYMVGFSIDPSSHHNKVNLGDSIIENLKQNVVNFSPNIHLTYSPTSSSSFDFDYSGSTTQPSLNQLSADTVIVNALNKYYGNPDLKPSYENNVNMYYQKSDYEKSRFLMISGALRYTLNNIVNYNIIDNNGNSTSTYRNVNGNMSASLGFMYNTPLKNKKFMINTNSFVFYTKNVGFTNTEKTITNNIALNQYLSGRFSTEKIETNLSLNISHNITRNNLSDSQDRNTTKYGFRHDFQIKLPYDFSIQNNIEYSHYAGYGDDFKKNETLWNAAVSKLFLKQKKGTLRLQLFDILNDRNNLTRTVHSDGTSEVRTNSINRYFMLSFSYRFNIIKSGNKNAEENFEGEF